MTRGPTTFSLILGLLVLALLLALTLAATLSLRTALHAVADTYGRLVVATALSVDELSMHADPGSRATVAELKRLGLHFSATPAPQPTTRILPMLIELQRTVGDLLADPSRVTVIQTPDPQIWIRSDRDSQRWIVLEAASYRQQVVRSTLFVTVVAGLIALAVAALGARLLTRPLERLAQNANAWLAGESVDDKLHGSPREVRRLAAAISDASERVRNAANERELMLAGISHDLRTPLARLRLALELGDASDPQRHAAMVDDLNELDASLEQCLSFVRDGRDEALQEVDVATIAGQLLTLRIQPDDWQFGAPPTLRAAIRPTLVRRAIGNLMDNAERYGIAPFTATLWRDGTSLHIRIGDHGPGVADHLLGKLGQPFLRGNPARGGGGSGLGLSIVARAAQLHGGSLQLNNAAGGGFVAELTLDVGSLKASPSDRSA